jgi:hypothetical protein
MPERGGGEGLLIGQQFGVGQARMVIDRGVHEVVADDGMAARAVLVPVAAAGGAAEHPPAAPVRDLAQLLDVHVHQLARCTVLISALGSADLPSSGPVQPAQASQPVAGQHAVHRRGVQAEQVADPRRPPPPRHPDLDDPPLGPRRRPPR